MNKKVFGRKLSRSRPAREALFASLAMALIKNGKIVTTRAKAKAVVPSVEKLVTLAKKGDVSSRRIALARLDNRREAVDMLFGGVAKAFSGKTSGFTRIVSLPRRTGDNAEVSRIEWTEKVETSDKKKVTSEKKQMINIKTDVSDNKKSIKKSVTKDKIKK